MLWYVLQTKTGEEERLVEMICRVIPKQLYGECFVIYHEQLWRRKQKNFVHVKKAFPGYAFITSKKPEALFFCLKNLPTKAKLMVDDESFFLSLTPEETQFLEQLTDESHVIGLSYLGTDGNGRICQVSGPLASCVSQIVRYQFGKRYVLVRINLLGQEKEVLLGIILNEDILQEIQSGKVKVPIQIPKQYKPRQTAKEKGTAAEKVSAGKHSKKQLNENVSSGDVIKVADGIFEGMSAIVYQANKKSVKIGIQLFERKMEVELPAEMVKKIR